MVSFSTILVSYLLIVTLVILGFLKDVSEKIKIWHMSINFIIIFLFALMRFSLPSVHKNSGKSIYASKFRWAKYLAIIVLCSFIITLTSFTNIDEDLKIIGYVYPGLVILLAIFASFINPVKIKEFAKTIVAIPQQQI